MPLQTIRLLPFVRVAAQTCYMGLSYGIVTQMQRMLRQISTSVAGLVLVGSSAGAQDVTVFAASSLHDVLVEVEQLYEVETGLAVTLVFAASSSIARQVAQGAPADVVLLADQKWSDWVVDQGAVAAMTPIAGNRLVLVSHGVALEDVADVVDVIKTNNLAMAQVDAVPAGRYGKAALQSLGLWDDVAPHVVQAANVRAALRFVERGEAVFGIGYASDLVALPHLIEVHGFAESSHPPIEYLGNGLTPTGTDFMDQLQSAEGQDALKRWGFLSVEDAQ